MNLAGKIVAMISCFMCSIPFLIISKYDRASKEPINFWSGDKTLKSKVKNVCEYNKEMALLYKKCGISFFVTGIGFLISPLIGIVMICFDCTLGIYFAYLSYKRILNQYS